MNTVHMMIGIQGSGKTTYAKELERTQNVIMVSSDQVRNERPDLEEKDIFPEVYNRCKKLLDSGFDISFDATNITPSVRKRIWNQLDERGFDISKLKVIAYYFVPNLELSKVRVEKRNKIEGERYLPIEVIDDYIQNLIPPTIEEGFEKIITIENYTIF